MNLIFLMNQSRRERISVNGDVFARQNFQNASGWEDALRNCFRGNITLSFETGKQNRMFISKAAIWALNNPSYIDLLMSSQDLTLLMLGANYPSPGTIRISETGIGPIQQARQEYLARMIDRVGWKKGYRYTFSAIIIPINRKPGLCFDMLSAEVRLPVRVSA